MSTPGEGEEVEDKKPIVQSRYITIKVNSNYKQDENAVFFKIKRNVKLKVLIRAYRERQSVDDSIVYLYNGTKIGDEDTPDSLEMEDVDEIDAMAAMDGGASD
ncbi:hypothetical protein ABFS82_13G165300 [Erythranthe guttata]|uniref:Rad60/SUMO-like domain-containing protein n=1 Tax=Erythranthe guttata TaxID=4155 RepID=A0A022QIC5_ERYGU|nr:PREDICTED: small ubiquitin-related modifier 2-like [Erythranthe guttata]EYU27369.1 hypothetical protein MIMGU_mgv1a016909mg [Erythranthe guttata]|eukprot:XP_012848563.1 PREDICTED: small ubiquitin-related modifier 2-like [Erythranthe guttata]